MKIQGSVIAAALAVQVCFLSNTAKAVSFISGSSFLTHSQADQISTWLKDTPGLTYTGDLVFTRVFRRNDDVPSIFNNAITGFHGSSDGIGPTITLLQVYGGANPNPQIIGGFNPQSWHQGGGYNFSPLDDRKAFIFNFDLQGNGPAIYRQSTHAFGQGHYQTYNHSASGPGFGASDLYVDFTQSGGFAAMSSYCVHNATLACEWTGQVSIVGEAFTTNISVMQFEVFTIESSLVVQAATPVPAALPLFAGGLGLIGLLGWRRNRKAQASALNPNDCGASESPLRGRSSICAC